MANNENISDFVDRQLIQDEIIRCYDIQNLVQAGVISKECFDQDKMNAYIAKLEKQLKNSKQ